MPLQAPRVAEPAQGTTPGDNTKASGPSGQTNIVKSGAAASKAPTNVRMVRARGEGGAMRVSRHGMPDGSCVDYDTFRASCTGPSHNCSLQAPLDGNEAAANMAYALSDVSFIYPVSVRSL